MTARLRIYCADDMASDDSWNYLVVSDDDRVLPMVGRQEINGTEKWRALSSGDLAKLAPSFDPRQWPDVEVIDHPPIPEED
jgi:hypothetical protein